VFQRHTREKLHCASKFNQQLAQSARGVVTDVAATEVATTAISEQQRPHQGLS